MRRNFIFYYFMTVVFIFVLSIIYEFLLESKLGLSHYPLNEQKQILETTAEHWKYVLTITIFTSFALLLPTFLLYLVDSSRHKSETEKLELQMQLEETLTQLLSGFVSICSECKKVRVEDIQNKSEEWEPVEHYIAKRTDLKLSHGYCPECALKAKKSIRDRFNNKG